MKRMVTTAALGALVLAGGMTAQAANVELRPEVAAIASWQFGESRESLSVVDDLVVAVNEAGGAQQDALARELLAVAKDDAATLEGRRFALRKLAFLCDSLEAEALAPLLGDEDLSHLARNVLENMGTDDAGDVLDEALDDTTGALQAGIAASLGRLEYTRAIGELSDLTEADDPAVAKAAIAALGNIGGWRAAWALGSAMDDVEPALRDDVARARLAVAKRYLDEGSGWKARGLYRNVYESEGIGDTVRRAAWVGWVQAEDRDEALEMIEAALGGDDPLLDEAARRLLRKRSEYYAEKAAR
jgi:hypothetical protein